MSLRITRTVGSAVVFHVKDRTAKLRLDDVEGNEARFRLHTGSEFKRPLRSADSTLRFQVRGELISVYVAWVERNRVILRISASENVHIVRRELAEAPK